MGFEHVGDRSNLDVVCSRCGNGGWIPTLAHLATDDAQFDSGGRGSWSAGYGRRLLPPIRILLPLR